MSTLLQLRTNVRTVAADTSTTDQLWSDTELTVYANDGEKQAAIAGRLITDSSTAAIATIAVVAGTATYVISPTIIEVKRAILTNATRPLIQTTKRVLDLTHDNWEAASGTSRSFFIGDQNKLTVYKNPDANTTLNLTVLRVPNTAMSGDSDTPEIDAQYHEGIELWMLHRMFQKQDSKTLDVDKAIDYERKFKEFFGIAPPVVVQREAKT